MNTLRRIGSLLLTLATFLIGPVLMLVVCFGVMGLVTLTQFLFALPLLAVFAIPVVAMWMWLRSGSPEGAN